jgi:hypothetical protein
MKLTGALHIAAVLAAMAIFGDATACPLGRELQVDQPTLPWQSKPLASRSLRLPPSPPKMTVLAGDATLARSIERELATAHCGVGRGELVVRVVRRTAVTTATGFDRITATCVERAIGVMAVRRIADDSFARVAIELR